MSSSNRGSMLDINHSLPIVKKNTQSYQSTVVKSKRGSRPTYSSKKSSDVKFTEKTLTQIESYKSKSKESMSSSKKMTTLMITAENLTN
jgi:hypothetical protein